MVAHRFYNTTPSDAREVRGRTSRAGSQIICPHFDNSYACKRKAEGLEIHASCRSD